MNDKKAPLFKTVLYPRSGGPLEWSWELVYVTPDRAAKWATTRIQGRWSYVWRTGVFQWGLIMFAGMGGSQIAQHPEQWLVLLGINLPLWLCGGFLFGLWTWHLCERSYAKYLAKTL